MTTTASRRSVGDHLRVWRQRRRMSQLALACEASVSARHLSFVETGRAQPSRDMLLHLAEQLEVPLRERNVLLVAAGYAPAFRERPLDDPALGAARKAIDLVLAGHEPYPALAVDRHWNLVAANKPLDQLIGGLPPALMEPPINVLRLSLHPLGLAPRIANLAEWRAHLLARLRRQIDLTADPVLIDLLSELQRFPAPRAAAPPMAADRDAAALAVPLRLATPEGVLSLISTVTVFGTPTDITLSELALEAFFPADAHTAEVLRAAASTPPA